MSKRKTPIVFRRDIILRLNGYEAIDLMHELREHEQDLKNLIKQINESKEAMFYEDTGLDDAQRSLDFTRVLNSRLLRIYRQWQKKMDKEAEKSDGQHAAPHLCGQEPSIGDVV